MSTRRKRAINIAACVALLGGAFLWALPEVVRRVALVQIPKRTGRAVAIEDVDLNLFTGRLAIKNLRLGDREGPEPFVAFERLDVRLSWRARSRRDTGRLDAESLDQPLGRRRDRVVVRPHAAAGDVQAVHREGPAARPSGGARLLVGRWYSPAQVGEVELGGPGPDDPDRRTDQVERLREFQTARGLDDAAALAAYYRERLPEVAPPDTVEAQLALVREREPVPEGLLVDLARRRVETARRRLLDAAGVSAARLPVDEAMPGSTTPMSATAGEGRVEFGIVAGE